MHSFHFLKTNGPHIEFHSRFQFIPFCCHRHVILRQVTKFYPNWTISDRVMSLRRFFNMAAIWGPYHRKSTSAFQFCDVWHLGRLQTICVRNFDQISQSEAGILLLPLAENNPSPYWRSIYSQFQFWTTPNHPIFNILRHLSYFRNGWR